MPTPGASGSGRPPLPPSAAAARARCEAAVQVVSPQGRRGTKAVRFHDVEAAAAAPACAAAAAAAGGGLTSKYKLWLCIAGIVLVASAATAIGVGVSQATKASSKGSPAPAPALPPPPPAPSPAPAAARSPRPPVQPPPAAGSPPPSPAPPSQPPPALPPPSSPPRLPPSPPPPAADVAPFSVPDGSVALFWDEFGGGQLDASRWKPATGKPASAKDAGQLQAYTPDPGNVRLADGNLLITARQDGTGYTSARIDSTASWYPGMQLPDGSILGGLHVEARIRPHSAGQGLWSAFWMSPPDMVYGGWPQSGEIDIMQVINMAENATQSLHYGGQWPQNDMADVSTPQTGQQLYSADFHTFAVDWVPDSITMYIDGAVTRTFTSRQSSPANGWWTAATSDNPQAPFDIPFSIVLNLAVGGSWPGAPDANTPFPSTMAVDYVRVWSLPQQQQQQRRRQH